MAEISNRNTHDTALAWAGSIAWTAIGAEFA
jgi:hypothetical protein